MIDLFRYQELHVERIMKVGDNFLTVKFAFVFGSSDVEQGHYDLIAAFRFQNAGRHKQTAVNFRPYHSVTLHFCR